MRKIIQYMMMALIAVVLASCANDISEESTPTVKSNIRFVVDDFPMFEKPSTRTIGEEDKGKTAWAVGDEICVKLESEELYWKSRGCVRCVAGQSASYGLTDRHCGLFYVFVSVKIYIFSDR